MLRNTPPKNIRDQMFSKPTGFGGGRLNIPPPLPPNPVSSCSPCTYYYLLIEVSCAKLFLSVCTIHIILSMVCAGEPTVFEKNQETWNSQNLVRSFSSYPCTINYGLPAHIPCCSRMYNPWTVPTWHAIPEQGGKWTPKQTFPEQQGLFDFNPNFNP